MKRKTAKRSMTKLMITASMTLLFFAASAVCAQAASAPVAYDVTVVGGRTEDSPAEAGATVTITADDPQPGMAFVQWAHVDGVDFADMSLLTTTFSMPAKPVTVTPVYAKILIKSLEDQVYTGEAFEPRFGLFDVSLERVDGLMIQGTHYAVGYEGNVDAGTATVTVTILPPRAGSASVTFEILPADLSEAEVSIDDQVYDGTELKPSPTVVWNGVSLVEDRDFDVFYSDNTDAGVAAATITGKGNFDGTIREKFNIAKADPVITGVSVISPAKVYDTTPLDGIVLGFTAEPPVAGSIRLDGGQTLTVGTGDYQWTYTPADPENCNIAAGTVSITVFDTPAAPAITADSLPDGKAGIPYEQTLTATGGEPIAWTLESGALPAGLILGEDGKISGTPTAAGDFAFTVKAANEGGGAAKSFTLTIAPADPVICTVTFNANGHGTAPAEQKVEKGKTAAKPEDPSEAGRTFGGWYTEAACNNAFDFTTPIAGDITLYAKWTESGAAGSPGTGDNGYPGFWLTLALSSLAALGAVIALGGKREENR